MPQFAPVVSLKIARLLEEQGLYGDYHLLLAHQILDDPQGWSDLFEGIRDRNHDRKETKVIVDNSIIELGEPLSDTELIAAATAVKADYLILPDCIDSLIETIVRTTGAHARLVVSGRLPIGCRPLGVIQGATYRECLTCAEMFRSLRLGAVAVPRGLPKLFRSRYELTKEVYRILKLPIHILGFSGYLEDDLATAHLERYGVMGIDSAVPIREGMVGRQYDYATNRIGLTRRPKTWLDQAPDELNAIVGVNLAWVRSQIKVR